MKTPEQVRSLLAENKPGLARKYKIKQLGLFGSYSRGDYRAESDIDILVEFSEPVGLEFIDLASELENILQNKVDLVSRGGIRPKYWKHIEPEVIYV